VSIDARKNFALSSIAVAPSPPGSGLILELIIGGGALMPAAPFSATCWPAGVPPLASNAEIVRVEAIEGDTVTLSARGQDGTSAQPIGPGWQFAQMITASDLEQLQAAIESETGRAEAVEALKAPLASPAFTGNPTAPTQTAKDSSTKLATTAFVEAAVGEAASALTAEEIAAGKALAWGHAYVANAEAGNLVLKLPAATGSGGGFLYVEVGPKSGAHTVTLESNGSEKIMYQGEELSTLVLSLEPAQALSGVLLIAVANNPRVF
jgi:hypothetical protein